MTFTDWYFAAAPLIAVGMICGAAGYGWGHRRGKIAVRDAFVEYPGMPAVSISMDGDRQHGHFPFGWDFARDHHHIDSHDPLRVDRK